MRIESTYGLIINGHFITNATFAVGTAGTDFNIAISGNTVTWNLPSASVTNRGVITTGTQTIQGAKTMRSDFALGVPNTSNGTLIFGSAGNAFTTTFTTAGAAPAASRTYLLPQDFGAAGSVLTDAAGNGVLSWAAGGGGGTPPFSDATALVKNAADNTKLFQLDASGVTAGQTVVLSASGTAAAPVFGVVAGGSFKIGTDVQLSRTGSQTLGGTGPLYFSVSGFQSAGMQDNFNTAGPVVASKLGIATSVAATPDAFVNRQAAGIVGIGATATGVDGQAYAATLRTAQTTVAGLPAAATAGAGARAYVTDATQTLTAGIGATVAGGGANSVPVVSDGANWIIG